jgi:hypothetical protein
MGKMQLNSKLKWTGAFQIIDPQSNTVKVTDNTSLDAAAYNNYSWYQRLVHGSSTRITRYQEYDIMDQDATISRALDLIAEEMTHTSVRLGSRCLNVNFRIQDYEVNSNDLNVINSLVDAFIHRHNLDESLFWMSRSTIKNGDLFFRRTEDGNWEYINPKHVVAAIVDEKDVTNVQGFQVRKDIKQPRQQTGGIVITQRDYETEILEYPKDIVWFSINNVTSDLAPFGESVLSPVYRVHKQLQLLEDAIIIYRVQRAPERRIFNIYVGRANPQRAAKILEQFRNEIRQKKIPSLLGGQSTMDTTYNPLSMTEDFFFAKRPGGEESTVTLESAGISLGDLQDLEYFKYKVLEGLRIPYSYFPHFTEQPKNNSEGLENAFVQEIQFSKFVRRLQKSMERTLNQEFKFFVQGLGLGTKIVNFILDNVYLTLPENHSYEELRRVEIDERRINHFNTLASQEFLSRRFLMKRYLGLSDEEIAANEEYLKEERGIDSISTSITRLYNPDLLTDDDDSEMLGLDTAPSSSPLDQLQGSPAEVTNMEDLL